MDFDLDSNEEMFKRIGPSKGLIKARGRGMLLTTLEKEELITKVNIQNDGRFSLETTGWEQYWQPITDLGCIELNEILLFLHRTWQAYLQSNFNFQVMREYCHSYFCLLDSILMHYQENPEARSWAQALQRVLGFECFGIASSDLGPGVLAAATTNLRNPCYLLSKIKFPEALEDPRFLPILTIANTDTPKLYYHYRRYSLSIDSPISLLLYPAVSHVDRYESFRTINLLTGGIRYSIDPRTRQRAERLSRCILSPILKGMKHLQPETPSLEFLDVGAGSGSLAASLCQHAKVLGESIGFSPMISLRCLDLDLADLARFFRSKTSRSLVDSLTFIGDDYRKWLNNPEPWPNSHGLRIAMASKLFNNLSNFTIRDVSKGKLPRALENIAEYDTDDSYLPSVCLATGRVNVGALAVSNTRIEMEEGLVFLQPSLSQFYRGIYTLMFPGQLQNQPLSGLFLPIRRFNPECLTTSDGKSIIQRITQNCDYLIIEDSDCRPPDLYTHMEAHTLHSVVVEDVAKQMNLRSNYAYVLWSSDKVKTPPNLSGQRIWGVAGATGSAPL